MRASRLILSCVLALAPLCLLAQREKLPEDDLETVNRLWPNAKKMGIGIRYVVEQEGHGDTPEPGDKATLIYVGRLLNGKAFDAVTDRDHPFTFRVGRSEVIQGWDLTIVHMKRGERRVIIIPPELGYGTRGHPPEIPRNSTLVFVMELLDFKKPGDPMAAPGAGK